jgi:hypothetical protein
MFAELRSRSLYIDGVETAPLLEKIVIIADC